MRSKQELERSIRAHRRAVLVVNTLSRRGHRVAGQAAELLQGRGLALTEVFLVKTPGDLAGVIKAAVAAGPELVVVGGGDGTVSRVAGALAYQDTVLGLLPLGTTNNFARNVGIPSDLPSAVEVIVNGKVADVDLGRAGDRLFTNVAGIGLSADVAAAVSPKVKHVLGRTAYTLSGAAELRRHQAFTADVQTETTSLRVRTRQLVVANGGFHGGTRIGDDVVLDDRKLGLFWLGNASRTRFIVDLGMFILAPGRISRGPRFLSCARVSISTDPALTVELDGELGPRTPISLSVAPEALKIMAPPSFRDT